jgi:hypothetical protein
MTVATKVAGHSNNAAYFYQERVAADLELGVNANQHKDNWHAENAKGKSDRARDWIKLTFAKPGVTIQRIAKLCQNFEKFLSPDGEGLFCFAVHNLKMSGFSRCHRR